ncbi:MAG: SDR family oxidoreductase, partial [Nanoarchaeota archaeon]
SFFDSNEKIWGEIIDTNLRGTYFCSKFVSEHMLKGDEGVIINIASNAGHIPRKDEGVEYGISKAGVIYLTKSLALILAPHIRVNCISPGYTNTEMSKFFTDDKLKEEVQSKIPLKRINDPENIAKLALFLTSPSSRNITGQNIIIDGGFSL